MSALGRAGRAGAALALLGLTLAAALMLVPALLGYQRYVITGGSMGGALPRGSLAYERAVAVERLRVGDVVTYLAPGSGRRVTHRIVAAGPARTFVTKGDASAARDPWRLRPAGATQARLAFAVPLAGYLFAALSIRWLRVLAIGVPALLAAAASLAAARSPAGRAA